MSRQLQAALAVILLPIAFFLLWYFPGYEGAIGCMVVILLSIFSTFYRRNNQQPDTCWSRRNAWAGLGKVVPP